MLDQKMKRLLLTLTMLFILACPIGAIAMEGWRVMSQAVWNKNLNDVKFVGEDSVWAVGDDGLIIHSSDGGFTWINQRHSSSSYRDLNQVFFINWLTGWAVGDYGSILSTTDGGFSWKKQTSNTGEHLYGIHFIDQKNGWIVGGNGVLLQTTDGGKTWLKKVSGTDNDLISVFFIDSQVGWVIEEYYYYGTKGKIRYTTDGGMTWSVQYTASRYLTSITFADSLNGWAVGYSGHVVSTTDGGTSWTTQTSGTYANFYATCFIDEKTGWAVGENGRIIYTSDGGTTWEFQSSGTGNNLYGVAITKSGKGLVVGGYGTVIGTQDLGTTWKKRNHGTNYNLRRVAFADSLHGWAVGNSGSNAVIIHTKDGGEKWYRQYSSGISLYDVFCTDTLRIWVVGEDGYVLYSSDGGANWSRQITETTSNVYAIYFSDVLHGWIGDASGNIEFTTDGGMLWRRVQYIEKKEAIYDIFMVDNKTGWACGSYGLILKTTDGGETWWTQNSGFSGSYDYFNNIFFINDSTGWAVGSHSSYYGSGYGRIVKTTNGGSTWETLSPNTNKKLEGIYFVDANRGWAVGNDGRILCTKDGGATWDFEYSRTNVDLKDVFFIDPHHGWIVGDEGKVLKYEGGLRYWADIDDNDQVNIIDIQLVASRWGFKIGDPGYGDIYDVNDQGVGDGKIDVIDIQLVANQWGWPNLPKRSSTSSGNESNIIASLVPIGTDDAGNFLFELRADGIPRLTGFEWSFSFDPTEAQFCAMELGELFRGEGQTVMPLGPRELMAGNIVLGGFRLTESQKSSGVLAIIKIKAEAIDQIHLQPGQLLITDKSAESRVIGLTTEVVTSALTSPEKFVLRQNYPNPFNPSTTIQYVISETGFVRLKIFDLLGKEITTLVSEKQQPGEYSIQWNPDGLASGIYVCRLEVGDFVAIKKLILMK